MKKRILFVIGGMILFLGFTIYNNHVQTSPSPNNRRLQAVSEQIYNEGFIGKIVSEHATFYIPKTTYNYLSFRSSRSNEVGSEAYYDYKHTSLNNYIREYEALFDSLHQNGYTLDYPYLAFFRHYSHLGTLLERYGVPEEMLKALAIQPLFNDDDIKERFVRAIFHNKDREEVDMIIDQVL